MMLLSALKLGKFSSWNCFIVLICPNTANTTHSNKKLTNANWLSCCDKTELKILFDLLEFAGEIVIKLLMRFGSINRKFHFLINSSGKSLIVW